MIAQATYDALRIAVHPIVTPVGPRRATLGAQPFALNLSACRYNKAPKVEDNEHDLMRPWKWWPRTPKPSDPIPTAKNPTPDDFVVIARKRGTPLQLDKYFLLEVVLDTEGPLPAVAASVDPETEAHTWTEDTSIDWDIGGVPDDKKRVEPALAEALIYLNTFPGELPHRLRLTHYFRLRAPAAPHGLTLDDVDAFVVAPAVPSDDRTLLFPLVPPPEAEGTLEPAACADIFQGVWLYEGTDVERQRGAIVKPTPVIRGGDHLRFEEKESPWLNFKSYWINVQSAQPWDAHVEPVCRDACDVFLRAAEARPRVLERLKVLDPEIDLEGYAKAVDRLALKAAAFYGQWEPPAQGTKGPVSPGTEKTRDLLKEVLLRAEVTDPKHIEAAGNGLDQLHRTLSAGDAEAEWLHALARALGVPEEGSQALDADAAMVAAVVAALLRDRSRLDAIVLLQWDGAIRDAIDDWLKKNRDSGVNKWATMSEEQRASVAKACTEFSARERRRRVRALINELMGEVSRAVLRLRGADIARLDTTQIEDERASADESAEKVLRSTLTAFLEEANEAAFPHFKPIRPDPNGDRLKAALDHFAEGYAEAEARAIRQQAPGGKRDEAPRSGPRVKPAGLTVQIDDIALDLSVRLTGPEALARVAADDDPWQRMAGLGVLVREKDGSKKGPWHLVTMARVELGPDPESEVNANGRDETAASATGESEDGRVMHEKARSETEEARSAVDLYEHVAAIPHRKPFEKGVRYPLITYRAGTLVAKPPLADADGIAFGTYSESLDLRRKEDPFRFVATTKSDPPRLCPVRLRSGMEYDVCLYCIDTAGGMPDELAEHDEGGAARPWRIAFDRWAGDGGDPGIELANVPTASFTYLRTASVGHARISPAPAEGEQDGSQLDRSPIALPSLGWPQLPAHVFPLAVELPRSNEPEVKGREDVEEDESAVPLVLLHREEARPGFVLSVRPPEVDIDVLEEWMTLRDDRQLKHLEKIRTTYHLRKALLEHPELRGPEGEFACEPRDLSVDDPAVGEVLLTLEVYDWSQGWKYLDQHVRLSFPFAETSGEETTPEARRRAFELHQQQGRVECFWCGGATEFSIKQNESDARTAGITFPGKAGVAGEDPPRVARLRMHPLIDRKLIAPGAGARIDKTSLPAEFSFPQGAPPSLQAVAEDYVVLEPKTVLLEAAVWEPVPGTILRDSFRLEVAGDAVSVVLRPKPEDRRLLRGIRRCDVLKQAWRWQGRPVDNVQPWLKPLVGTPRDGRALDPSALEGSPIERDLLVWEQGAAADLDDRFDTFELPTDYPYADPMAPVAPLEVDRLDKDPRAYYLRYGLRAHYRYEGLRPEADQSALTQQRWKHGRHGTPTGEEPLLSGIGWRRAFIPYRGDPPPPPALGPWPIIPLTRPLSAGRTHPTVAPLMVPLDGPHFAACGITEQIQCEVVKVEVPPTETLTGERHIFQVAPDPILATPEEVNTYRQQWAGMTELSLMCDSYLGRTFDTDARQPLFAASSFLLHPHEKFGPWDFALVRFRRVAGFDAGTDPNGKPLSVSEWTTPRWVQFLPSSLFGLKWDVDATGEDVTPRAVGKGVARLEYRPASETTGVRDEYLFNTGPSAHPFHHYVLWTQSIYDHAGRTDPERYVTVTKVSVTKASHMPGTTAEVTFALPPDPARGLQCRLVEVQGEPLVGPDNEGNIRIFWERLLGSREGEIQDDARARITRISPPFPYVRP